MDGVRHTADCFAGETAVINSEVPLQEFVLSVGLRLALFNM